MAVMVVATMNLTKGEHYMYEPKLDEQVTVNTMSARLKRVAIHSERYGETPLDKGHVKGSFVEFPRLGMPFTFGLDKGYWTTTRVLYTAFADGKVLFATENSAYELTDGWES